MDTAGNADHTLDGKAGEAPLTELRELSFRLHTNFESIEHNWRQLEQMPWVSPHQSLHWCKAWVATHASELAILEGHSSGETHVILPLEIIQRGPFRTAQFIGTLHSNLNTGLFTLEHGVDLRRALKGIADLVILDRLPSIVADKPNPLVISGSVRNQNSAFQLTLRPTMEATLQQLNAKRRRKKFSLSQRRMQALGGYSYVIATTPEEHRGFLDAFFEQKAARFQSLDLPEVFGQESIKAFFQTLAAENSDLLQMNAIRLQDGSNTLVAIAGLTHKGGRTLCQFSSINETVADASPGELLFYHMIERACQTGQTVFDFGIGDQAFKRSWCTVETPHYDTVVPLTWKGHIGAALYRLRNRLLTALKTHLRLYSLIQSARRRLS
ncbi:GNAT family N-acetyltransferase [Rhizobium sp. CFBP 8762]|uniref:GNAT family N-acetyltransferase n=1 Tax=Rhizobium sp. CFBP 8762 TaxID=2775279 RepID=UPI00177E72CE|nr:GNAT family N-acetyltransferase [Rhizobium sp. CFBP 8762]MBD8552990.1 GNAT family N-acetyltransferase [Rhizobium sp. CFBP 8762]